MSRRPTRLPRTDTLFPYTTLLRSGRYHLGIELRGALRLDHFDEFLDDIDVRSSDHPPAQAATPFLARTADQRRARGLRLDEHIAADRLQPRRVGEARDLDPAEFERGAVGGGRRNGAAEPDRHIARILGNLDRGGQRLAVRRHHRAVACAAQLARAGVPEAPVAHIVPAKTGPV